MRLENRIFLLTLLLALVIGSASLHAERDYKELTGKKVRVADYGERSTVRHRCLIPPQSSTIKLPLDRDKPWSLPNKALAAAFDTTIHVLVLRYNFQLENPDDPNTTGLGHFNMADYQSFLDSAGHDIDPSPHDSLYFDAHMQALKFYWEQVSEGKLSISWEIWPPGPDSAYQLPEQMNYYGRCDSVVLGLENYFQDCITVADSVSPELHFADYQSVILFHAGSDRQNDIGFPETCNDLFTGFIQFGGEVLVDSGAYAVNNALMMPETASQDNRATALNAVMAHEFGHQLGLVDLYDTRIFFTQLGDFSLMDNNGFGTGIEFVGSTVGNVFGAIPVYPTAWSRAFLGFVEVYDFRQGTDIRVAAAEIVSNSIKVARVPISEKEYYLIENRLVDTDNAQTVTWADRTTSVIMGPGVSAAPPFQEAYLTGEYDFLIPGSGLLIYHVDEGVIGLDYDNDGKNNFDDNQLQWDWDRRFITLVEGDGLVNFGGSYFKGYGEPEDMYRDDRSTAFTPNTNPQAIDNSGNNTRVYITDIARVIDSSGGKPVILDTLMHFNVETDNLAAGFPVRAGSPIFGLNPVFDDIDRDGSDEIIVASGKNLSVISTDGLNFILNNDSVDCSTCPLYYDVAIATVNPGQQHTVPIYVQTADIITTSPVTGDFGDPNSAKYVALGSGNAVRVYRLRDNDLNGQADNVIFGAELPFNMAGMPIATSFGDILWALDDQGNVWRLDSLAFGTKRQFTVNSSEFHGIARVADALIVLGGDSVMSELYYVDSSVVTFSLDSHYSLGPVVADLDLNGTMEIITCSQQGEISIVSITPGTTPLFTSVDNLSTGYEFTVNPVIGDIDNDGHPDIIIGGVNNIYAYNHELVLKTDFPREVSDHVLRLNDPVIWPPIIADIDRGGSPEIIFPTNVGNIYSFGQSLSYGFPLSAGEKGAGSPIVMDDDMLGKLGYLGADGWFYLWDVDLDSVKNYWPMGGADASGSFNFDSTMLPAVSASGELFSDNKFYNYPNPVTDGSTIIRYYLGQQASEVSFAIYDFSGEEIDAFPGPVIGGIDNELTWNCSAVTPGIYRCVIKIDFGGQTETAFTDIAIIR